MTVKKKRKKVIESLSCLGKLLQNGRGIGGAVDDLIFLLGALLPAGPAMIPDPNRFLRKLWHDVAEQLAWGCFLADALKKHPSLIDHKVVGLIELAEKQGDLPKILYDLHSGSIVDSIATDKPEVTKVALGNEHAVVDLANKILLEANEKGAEQLSFPLPPVGITPLPAKPSSPENESLGNLLDELGNETHSSSIYFRIAGKWTAGKAVPGPYCQSLILRFLFMAGLPHWTKSEISGSLTIKTDGEKEPLQYSLTFYPNPLRITINRKGKDAR